MEVSWNRGTPSKIIHFKWAFPLSTIHLGIPTFMDPPTSRNDRIRSLTKSIFQTAISRSAAFTWPGQLWLIKHGIASEAQHGFLYGFYMVFIHVWGSKPFHSGVQFVPMWMYPCGYGIMTLLMLRPASALTITLAQLVIREIEYQQSISQPWTTKSDK